MPEILDPNPNHNSNREPNPTLTLFQREGDYPPTKPSRISGAPVICTFTVVLVLHPSANGFGTAPAFSLPLPPCLLPPPFLPPPSGAGAVPRAGGDGEAHPPLPDDRRVWQLGRPWLGPGRPPGLPSWMSSCNAVHFSAGRHWSRRGPCCHTHRGGGGN